MAATFTFAFIALGQGDCCMVRCPDGKIVVVDCGSTANAWGSPLWYSEAQILLRDATWAGGNGNKIDALILTHSDADHINKVVNFFNSFAWNATLTMPSTGASLVNPSGVKINIDAIYISDSYADNSPLGNYTAGAVNANVYNDFFSTNFIYEVTINDPTDANNFFKKWSKPFSTPVPPPTANAHLIAGKRFPLPNLSGTTNGQNWSVSIVAGNVAKGYGGVQDGATADNAKSLIILFQVGTKKALLCGDATFSTERFLRAAHNTSGLISNVDLLQVPHHGSKYASGSLFVQMTNPLWAVTSVGFFEHSFRFPRYDSVLERWLGQVEGRGTALPLHYIDYWTKYKSGSKAITASDLQALQNSWTKSLTDFSLVERPNTYFWYLKTPEAGAIAFYFTQSEILYFFREAVDSPFMVTSQKTQIFDLSETGVTYRG